MKSQDFSCPGRFKTNEKIRMKDKKITIMFLVAGISSRFNGKIKQLVRVTPKKTLIEYSMDQALNAGFSKIIFIVGNKTKTPFKKKFSSSYKGIPIRYAFQEYDPKTRDRPWGTVDAICSATSLIDGPIVVCNGDDIYGENTFKTLIDHLKTKKHEAMIGYRLKDVLPTKGTVNRGMISLKEGYVTKIKDSFNISIKDIKSHKLNPERLCSMNIYAFHPMILKYLRTDNKLFKKANIGNRTIENRLPHAVSRMIADKNIKVCVYPSTEKWLGVTNPGDELKVRKYLK